MKVLVTRLYEFEAAHRLPDYDGACAHLHGHSYKLEVTVSGPICPESGMVMDFHTVDKYVKPLVCALDHSLLNDIYPVPTAERMVVDLFSQLDVDLPRFYQLERVRLWETSKSYAEATR